ncbi:MAG: hypothetical protein Q7S96_02255 [bacterium]|nr:hypothetical protein [bacterium]
MQHEHQPRRWELEEPFVVPRAPAKTLITSTTPLHAVCVHEVDRRTPVTEEVSAYAERIAQGVVRMRATGVPVPFNGPLANIVRWTSEHQNIVLFTERTDYFTYLAASHLHRDDPAKNPIRPLAVAVAPFGERGMCYLQRRSGVTEMAGNVHIFGASVAPGMFPDDIIARVAEQKLGVDVPDGAFTLTGMVHEAVQNVLTVTYAVELNAADVERVRAHVHHDLIELSATDEHGIEEFLREHPITRWNPDGFLGFLAGLRLANLRTADELSVIEQRTREHLAEHPYRYVYPAQHYLRAATL